jgi:hypothetical protein
MLCRSAASFDNLVGAHEQRWRRTMKPEPIGSETVTNTIGIVRLSLCSAAVIGVECVRITSGRRLTSSFASTLRLIYGGGRRITTVYANVAAL